MPNQISYVTSVSLAVLFCFLLIAVVPVDVLGQEVRGTVTDAQSGEPIPGVNVVVAETTIGTTTDMDGEYSLSLPSDDVVLVFSFIGYLSRAVPVQQREVVNVELDEDIAGLEELVVIGYGTTQRRYVTGSISSVDVAEQTETAAVSNVTQLLQGRVPGLNLGGATTAEGNVSLEVRGQNSIHAGNEPLIVVDGMPFYGQLADINPNDVQSIDVLKGASAAAVYGASAAAGVLEVTTKRGVSPEATINFKSSVGVARPWQNRQPYGPEEYLQYLQDARQRLSPNLPDYYYANPANLPSDITLDEWLGMGSGNGDRDPERVWLGRLGLTNDEMQNYAAGNTINWYDEVFQNTALRQNYDLSVSGNPEFASYYVSFGYVDNEGSLVGDRFQAVRGRMNISSTVTDWLQVNLNSQYSSRNRENLTPTLGNAIGASPYGDMYEEDGSLKWQPHNFPTVDNPFLWTERAGRSQDWNSNSLIANLSAEVTLPYGFGYQVRWGNDLGYQRSYLFNPSTVPFGQPAGNASRQENSNYRWQVDNILTWEYTFDDIHTFETTFLHNIEKENYWNTSSTTDQFPLEYLGYSGLSLGVDPSVDANDAVTTGSALMGRINYRLLDRYLLTLSYRRDGYSAFGEGSPYAYFPSMAVGWQLNEEPFFNVDLVSDLRLRFSWGVNGNRDIGTYSALRRMFAARYLYGTDSMIRLSGENLPNRNLQWERTAQYNAGVDFGLMEDRISGSIGAYYMSSENLLLQRSLPNITGYSSVWANLGEVVNRGIEMDVHSVNIPGDEFRWSSSLTFSMNRNEIKALYGDGEDDRQNDWFIGRSLNVIYDYDILGVWQQDEADEAAVYGKAPGDFKLRDVNEDGVLSPVEDKVFLGHTVPRYRITLGNDIQYRNFSVSMLITSNLGQYATQNARMHASYGQGQANQLKFPYWTPDNPTNEYARIASDASNPGFNYWTNTSFVKLQNLTITYQLPESLIGLAEAQNMQVFFDATNVLAISPYDVNDPETQSYTPRLYSLGVNLTF